MQLRFSLTEQTKNMIQVQRSKTRALLSNFLQGAREASEELAKEVISGLSGERLKTGTGALKRGVQGRANADETAVNIRVGITKGAATPYARKQEEGGTVQAKPGHALPVPLPAAKRGRARVPSPSELPETIKKKMFVLERAGRPPLLCLDKSRMTKGGKFAKGSRLEPWYVLVKQVEIPASHWLSEPIELAAPRVVPRVIERAMGKAVGLA